MSDLIKKIKEHRKTQKGKCMLTTHIMQIHEFNSILPKLKKSFKNYRAEVSTNQVALRIPMT